MQCKHKLYTSSVGCILLYTQLVDHNILAARIALCLSSFLHHHNYELLFERMQNCARNLSVRLPLLRVGSTRSAMGLARGSQAGYAYMVYKEKKERRARVRPTYTAKLTIFRRNIQSVYTWYAASLALHASYYVVLK